MTYMRIGSTRLLSTWLFQFTWLLSYSPYKCCIYVGRNIQQTGVQFQVVSVLDPSLKVKSNLIKFVLKRQLAEYGIMFADSEDGAWLDKVTLFYGLFNMEIISDLIIK